MCFSSVNKAFNSECVGMSETLIEYLRAFTVIKYSVYCDYLLLFINTLRTSQQQYIVGYLF